MVCWKSLKTKMLLPPKTCGRLERMRFNPRQRLTSRSRGDHLSGRGGNSTEFSDYRDYSPGDDMRFIDWNIFSRLQKPYLKLFHLEEEMNVVIIIDASSSMKFGSKFDCTCKLAEAFTTIGLYSNEKISIYTINDENASIPQHIGPASGRFNNSKFNRFIGESTCGGSQTLEDGIEKILKKHNGRGMAIILSDFLTAGDLQKSFNLLFSKGLAPYALQILSPEELNPELSGDARFVDCETKVTLDISAAGQLTEIYLEYLHTLQQNISDWARNRSGLYVSCSSDCDIDALLFDTLVRRGWIK